MFDATIKSIIDEGHNDDDLHPQEDVNSVLRPTSTISNNTFRGGAAISLESVNTHGVADMPSTANDGSFATASFAIETGLSVQPWT